MRGERVGQLQLAIVCAPAELQRTRKGEGNKQQRWQVAGGRGLLTSHCCVKQLQLALVVASKLPEVLSRYRTSLLSLSLLHSVYLCLTLSLSLFCARSLFASSYRPCCSQLSLNLPAGRATSVAGAAQACLVLLASCCICSSSDSWLGCVVGAVAVASLFAMPRNWQRAVSYLVSWLHCCPINAAGRS